MNFKSVLAAIAIVACGSVSAQNATKADLNKLANQVNELSQKVTQLESNLERVITENVNLVEQLDVKTVTSVKDVNGLQWDIVKVEPDDDNNVVLTLRITNNSGKKMVITATSFDSYAIDSNSNQNNNKYDIKTDFKEDLSHSFSINKTATIKNVPSTSPYMSLIQLHYLDSRANKFNVKFTGVHIPW